MALKDVSKIVANQVGLEKAREEANATTQSRQWTTNSNIDLSKHEPADVTGHKGFKYDSGNPFHKDLLNTLLKSGDAGKITIHEGGALSLPKEVAYKEGISTKFSTAADTAGGEKTYTGEAAKLAKRPSEKDSKTAGKRPTGPVEAVAAALTVDQARSAKRMEMEKRQEIINERIRRQRGEK